MLVFKTLFCGREVEEKLKVLLRSSKLALEIRHFLIVVGVGDRESHTARRHACVIYEIFNYGVLLQH